MLVTSGPSWASTTYLESGNFKRKNIKVEPFDHFAEIIAEDVDQQVLDIAVNGNGNDQTFNKTVDAIKQYEPNYVIILWGTNIKGDDEGWIDAHRRQITDDDGIFRMLDMTINYAHEIQKMCDVQNIRHLQAFCSLEYIVSPVGEKRESIVDFLKNHTLYDAINKDAFVGWPIFKELGGYTIKDFMKDNLGNDYWISKSPKDSHPNKQAHRLIAFHFTQKLEYLYGMEKLFV